MFIDGTMLRMPSAAPFAVAVLLYLQGSYCYPILCLWAGRTFRRLAWLAPVRMLSKEGEKPKGKVDPTTAQHAGNVLAGLVAVGAFAWLL